MLIFAETLYFQSDRFTSLFLFIWRRNGIASKRVRVDRADSADRTDKRVGLAYSSRNTSSAYARQTGPCLRNPRATHRFYRDAVIAPQLCSHRGASERLGFRQNAPVRPTIGFPARAGIAAANERCVCVGRSEFTATVDVSRASHSDIHKSTPVNVVHKSSPPRVRRRRRRPCTHREIRSFYRARAPRSRRVAFFTLSFPTRSLCFARFHPLPPHRTPAARPYRVP